jgi:hypothetical protein
MLYVEQPVGTGFSYGHPYPENEHDVSADLDVFLQNFYRVFVHLQPYNFYVMGESYAGMFVPSIARYIHLENKNAIKHKDTSRIHVPISGAAIGNGWMNPYIQGPATIDYSWWHGLIDQPTRDALHQEWKNCLERKGKSNDVEPPPFHPFNVQDDCGIMWGVLVAAGFPNAYDITTWDPNVDQVTFSSEVFYNDPAVKKALHAPDNITWHGCRQGEGRRRLLSGDDASGQQRRLYMDNDRPLSVVPYVADLVDDGVPVLVYNGDRDMTTNMVGSELLLNEMEWSGQDKWMDAPRGLWMSNNYQAGWAKEHKNLTFVVVYNSGHMVPYNQPGPSEDLLKRFLLHSSFVDQEMPRVRVGRITHPGKMHAKSSVIEEDSFLSDVATYPYMALHGNHHMETLVVAAVSMLVGFVLALWLVARRGGARGQQGYRQVPDAEL